MRVSLGSTGSFDDFEETPIASASIGQVHRARLKTGQPVVVKVQHADIQRKIRVDLDILAGLAQMAERGLELINQSPRVGSGGQKYAFVHPKSAHGVLLELYEKPK